uniref:Gamma-glutamyltransferase 5a n=1 Tax=Myripristis murdjan TaxID=586833 RepID=A0A667ZRB8_9TELE
MARSKARVYMCCSLILLCLVAIIVCIALLVRRRCPAGAYLSAAVAADSETCSEIARDILQLGGSAVDGAIAALLCTAVINPQSTGIGGGAIFTVMDHTGNVKVINSRETVPKVFRPDLLAACPKTFHQWIGVPGEIRGFELAHKLYGKLPWASLFQPTIKLARDGFPIPEVQGRYLKHTDTNQTLKLFSDEHGNLLKTGDIVKFEKLADTLEIIANEGADAFYTGKIAEDLIRDIQEAGGTLTMEDLASFQATVTDSWVFPLGEYQMHVPPPPAGGVFLSLILNIMKGYELDSTSLMGQQKVLTYHRYVEAFKFVNGLKKYIHDPNFSSEEVRFIAFQYYCNLSTTNTGCLSLHYSKYHVESQSTVSLILYIQRVQCIFPNSFGSKVFSSSTGVILNNQLSDFCKKTDHIIAGERPPSSMSPAVLVSKSKTLVVGGTGGNMITTGMASMLMNHLWLGKSLEEAIAAPVVYVDPGNALKFESKFDQALKALGHIEEKAKYFYNVVNVVEKEDSCIYAVSDARKKGKAAGY